MKSLSGEATWMLFGNTIWKSAHWALSFLPSVLSRRRFNNLHSLCRENAHWIGKPLFHEYCNVLFPNSNLICIFQTVQFNRVPQLCVFAFAIRFACLIRRMLYSTNALIEKMLSVRITWRLEFSRVCRMCSVGLVFKT